MYSHKHTNVKRNLNSNLAFWFSQCSDVSESLNYSGNGYLFRQRKSWRSKSDWPTSTLTWLWRRRTRATNASRKVSSALSVRPWLQCMAFCACLRDTIVRRGEGSLGSFLAIIKSSFAECCGFGGGCKTEFHCVSAICPWTRSINQTDLKLRFTCLYLPSVGCAPLQPSQFLGSGMACTFNPNTQIKAGTLEFSRLGYKKV